MRTQNKAVWIVLLATAMFTAHIGSQAEGLGTNKDLQSVESAYPIQSSAEGIGLDQQEAVAKAAEFIKQGNLTEADSILDGVLRHFAGLMRDRDKTYVSFRDSKDYEQFLNELQAKQGKQARAKVTRVHDSFTQALQLKAFIASSREQWDQAISYLDRKISYAPYEAQPYLEKGYSLTAQGKPQEGFESYQKAYALAVAHNAALQEKAAALRGMGSALIELGKLDEAEDSFNKSLEIEPGNRVALSELEYIKKVRSQGR
jgi:tetratricopeptide (TPR) repeat protein